MDESRLIEDALHGDQNAFNQLILIYQGLAYNLAFRLLNDAEAAEDATQTAFISAYRKLSSFRGGSFKAWLMRIITNICYDEMRLRYRQPTVPLEPVNFDSGEEIESPAWLVDGKPTPEEQVVIHELDALIQRSIQELPPDYRAIVLLVDVLGFDYQEAAMAVGKPLGTVKSRLARARHKLRRILSASGVRSMQPVYAPTDWSLIEQGSNSR